MNEIFLFDVDGTIAESSQKVGQSMLQRLRLLKDKGHELGIVGGSSYSKITDQLCGFIPDHIFSENGCVYHYNDQLQYKRNIRDHPLYPQMNILVKVALEFLSKVDYTVTGQFIDLRNGIIYVSLIGAQANLAERAYFIDLDKKYCYRKQLLKLLTDRAKSLDILDRVDILEGGSVGIGIHPKEWDKVQVASHPYLVEEYKKGRTIHYFGDKWTPEGNDHNLLKHEIITGHKVDKVEDTMRILSSL